MHVHVDAAQMIRAASEAAGAGAAVLLSLRAFTLPSREPGRISENFRCPAGCHARAQSGPANKRVCSFAKDG